MSTRGNTYGAITIMGIEMEVTFDWAYHGPEDGCDVDNVRTKHAMLPVDVTLISRDDWYALQENADDDRLNSDW